MRTRISYSPDDDILYLTFRYKSVPGRLYPEPIGRDIYLDVDEHAVPIALEVFDASYHFGKAACLAMARHGALHAPRRNKRLNAAARTEESRDA